MVFITNGLSKILNIVGKHISISNNTMLPKRDVSAQWFCLFICQVVYFSTIFVFGGFTLENRRTNTLIFSIHLDFFVKFRISYFYFVILKHIPVLFIIARLVIWLFRFRFITSSNMVFWWQVKFKIRNFRKLLLVNLFLQHNSECNLSST